MQQTLVFATGNAHKVAEVAALLPPHMSVMSMRQMGFTADIPEPYETLAENAAEKCRVLVEALGKDCFAEDSGLFVAQLKGAPGVRSARYAGEPANDTKNIEKLIASLDFEADTSAYFETVIALFWQGEMYFFSGRCNGQIVPQPTGDQGFGYDPVFIPEGAASTFAQMTKGEKSRLSHRAKAVAQLVQFFHKS